MNDSCISNEEQELRDANFMSGAWHLAQYEAAQRQDMAFVAECAYTQISKGSTPMNDDRTPQERAQDLADAMVVHSND